MSLREVLGTESWAFVGKYLSENYIQNQREKERRAAAIKRDALYEGRGDEYIEQMIDVAFKNQLTKKLRKDLVKWAKYNNVSARIVNEVATVYNEPSVRRIGSGDEGYQSFLDVAQQDDAMRELDRKLELHEDVWVQYRVRKADRRPVIDVVSPARFWAVAHPGDPTALIAIILDQTPDRQGAPVTDPHYRVWTSDETFQLDGNCLFLSSTYEPWPIGRMPGILATSRQPTAKGRLLNESAFADGVAAHENVWFQELLLLKESKSANKQTYHTGDTSMAALGQAADSESDVVLPEGVSTQAVDRGMDLSQFRDNADHVLERAAANRGLPPSVLHHRDASSGAEIHLRRIPIRELRRRRIPVMRRVERELAEIQSLINARDLSEFSFSTDGWSIDFGEVQQPMTALEALSVFEKERQLVLKDTIEFEMERNPDLRTREDAWKAIENRINSEVRRLVALQALMALNGGVATGPDNKTPEQNGLSGQDSADKESDDG